MFKAAILLLCCLGFAAPQEVQFLECNFQNYFGDYSCFLEGIELSNWAENFTFVGEHVGDNTDADVVYVNIRNSSIPFVIQEIFSQFSNIEELYIGATNLQTLRIPPDSRLEWLTISGNNVSRIDSNSISNLERLEYFSAHNNNILEIDEEAFQGLPALWYAGFINNHVSTIAPRTFHSMISARTIDFEGNNLTRIEDDIFEFNRNLTTLYLERNQIDAVSPTFTRNLEERSLGFVNFSGNRCANHSFSTSGEFERMFLNAGLNTCFQNFVGAQETRRFTIETSGPFILHDQFGNVVARM